MTELTNQPPRKPATVFGLGVLRGFGVVFALAYLFMPNFGIFEIAPDAVPFIGHLDEMLASFVLATGLKLFPNNPQGDQNAVSKILPVLATIIGLIYLFFPTFSVAELLPDLIPVIGNVDEMLASFAVMYGGKNILSGLQAKRPDLTRGNQMTINR